MDISGAIEEYLQVKQNSITHDTLAWYAHFLNVFNAWCKEHRLTTLAQISASHVQQFVSDCPTPSTNTKHHRAQIIKGFLNWCAQDEDMGVRERTVKRVEMPKTTQPDITIFTQKDIEKLLRACDKTLHPYRNKAIVHLLLDTGIRAAELCFDSTRPEETTGLRLENLILDRGTDSYVRVLGKGRKPRTVGFGYETSLAVRRYLNHERRRADSPYVILSKTGEPLSVKRMQEMLCKLGDIAGVPDCHPHRFRHTFAVNQLMNGTSALVLMQLMGHTTLDSTKIYTRAMSNLQARKASSSVVDRMKRKSPR
jgi:site-specific recombinase XerD